MNRLCFSSVIALCLAIALTAPGQQVLNGSFDDPVPANDWTNHPWSSTNMDWSVNDINLDSDKEMVISGANLFTLGDNRVFIQDLSTEYINLDYGIALAADNVGVALDNDLKSFFKIEFGTNGDLAALGPLTMSTEWDPTLCVSGSVARTQATLVKHHRELTNQLAGLGITKEKLGWVRAVLFLYNTGGGPIGAGGQAWFDNVSFGLVSRSYDVPGIINGDFEYDNWGWREHDWIPYDDFARTRDLDGDGDKELVLKGTNLLGQYSSRMWVQEVDATMIDFSQGVSMVADIGASNLSHNLKAFHKMEFATNGLPYGGGDPIPTVWVSGEDDPALFAATNETRMGSTITMSYETLTDAMHNAGAKMEDLTFVRTILFLMQFEAQASATGFAWFDNVELQFAYKDQPNTVTSKFFGTTGIDFTWESTTGVTYKIQHLSDIQDYRWTNLLMGVNGKMDNMSTTFPFTGRSGFFRVIRE